jgi:DNA-binding winged helix-turn-helix (wHTH) protein/Tol biopolymer transport system component
LPNGKARIRFGDYEADLHTGELRKSGHRIKLQEQPFIVLQILLEQPGELVTREELRSRIWSTETFGDFDHAVNVAVGKLRTALGDSADSPSFIETVPRRGYRFVAAVDSAIREAPPASPGAGPDETPADAAPFAARSGGPADPHAPDSPPGTDGSNAPDSSTWPGGPAAFGGPATLGSPAAPGSPTAQDGPATPGGLAGPGGPTRPGPAGGPGGSGGPTRPGPAGGPGGSGGPTRPGPAGGPGESGGSVPSRRGRAGRALLALGGAALLVGLGALLGRHSASAPPPDFQRLTVGRGTIYAARFAPGGRNVIYAASWSGAPIEIFSTDPQFRGTQALGLPATSLLGVSASGVMAVLQPFERRAMFTLRGTLGQVPLAGGSPRQLAENIDWADWSPDGAALAVVREAGGKQRLELPPGHLLYETSGWISHPRFSPRGDQIAFLDHPTYPDDRGGVAVVDRAGVKKTLSADWESTEGLAWSPDASEVWFSAARSGLERRIYAVDLAGRQSLRLRAPGGITLQDIAADGRLLLTRDDQRVGMMALARGAAKERDLSWHDWSVPMDLSADGNTLLFDEQGSEGGPNYTVAVRDMAGSPPTPLGDGVAGALSPDGKWATTVRANDEIQLLPTGAGHARSLPRGDIQQYAHGARWMPGGNQLLFSGNQAGHAARCFLQAVDGGGKPRAVTPEGVSPCRVSPDGKLLAGSALADRGTWLFPLAGGPPRPIPGLLPGEDFTWTSDPRYLYTYLPNQTPVKVYRLDLQSGARQLVRELNPPDAAGLGNITQVMFSADGQAYVYRYTRLLSELYLVTSPPGSTRRSN